ncbi:hypothetical protein A0H81_02463 [Grifola frondosa]|uniref:Fungal N-terminal domain-containing protein n=1 Tax=Grifola frondosa TaxID=5627 RepID=A0A1C7MPK5_GRIFR|nr:hypothetical protein A0H81_02463 [Grifola frondosa]
MLPISFSSFGDIVTAADLALRIAKALSDSTGSAFEYQCLVNELRSLSYVLKLADCAVKSTALRQDIRHGIDSEIARCRDIMNTLSNKIKKYQKMLGYGVGSSWMKIGWGFRDRGNRRISEENVQESGIDIDVSDVVQYVRAHIASLR